MGAGVLALLLPAFPSRTLPAVHTCPVGGVRSVAGPVSARLRRLVDTGNRLRLRGRPGVPWGADRGPKRVVVRPA